LFNPAGSDDEDSQYDEMRFMDRYAIEKLDIAEES